MDSVGSVQFQIVPCCSLYFFSRSIGPLQCSQCLRQGFSLLHLSLPEQFPLLFILASSVCKSLQCLISALTQGGEGGHIFRLTCLVVLWGVRNTANKYHCGECSQCLGHTEFAPTHDMYAFLAYTARAPGYSARDLYKAGPWLCALPRSKPLRFRLSGTPQRH